MSEDIQIVETTCEECPIGKGEWCKGCDSFPYKKGQTDALGTNTGGAKPYPELLEQMAREHEPKGDER